MRCSMPATVDSEGISQPRRCRVRGAVLGAVPGLPTYTCTLQRLQAAQWGLTA